MFCVTITLVWLGVTNDVATLFFSVLLLFFSTFTYQFMFLHYLSYFVLAPDVILGLLDYLAYC